MSNDEQKVFISYAWGGESERITNELDADLQENGITIIRDKRALEYKGSISEFMDQIGQGQAIIVVVSDKYLKSPNCMYELVEIAKNKGIHDRIFPIVLEDADIYDPVRRIKYIKHWEDKLKELDDAMKSVSSANLQGLRDEIDSYDDIRDNISNLTYLLKDMNTLTPEMHEGSDFSSLISALKERLDKVDRESSQKFLSESDTSVNLLEIALQKLGHPTKVYSRIELEKKILDNILGNDLPITFIHGLPGSGKTILLGETAKNIHQTRPNIFTLKFTGVLSAEPAYFIEELNDFLFSMNAGLDPASLTNQDWHRSLEALKKPISKINQLTIILDEVDQAPPDVINTVLDQLLPHTKFVMSARSRTIPDTFTHFITVPPLQETESMEILSSFGGLPEGIDENSNWLGQVPKKIKENPQRLKLLISNLRDVPLEVLLDDGIDELAQHPSKLTHTIIQELPEDTLRILSIIILLEGLDLYPSLKSLNITLPKGIRKALTELLGKSLIYRQRNAYLIPSLVREAAVEKMPKAISDNTVQEVEQAIQAISISLQKNSDQADNLIPIIANFFLHLGELEYHDQIINLASADLIETINQQGFWKEYQLILRTAYKAAKQNNDQIAIANIGFRIVRKAFQINDIQTSRQSLSDLENILDKDKSSASRISAELLSHRALFTEMDGNSKGALEQLQQSLEIYTDLGDVENISAMHNLMGNIYRRQKETSQARASYKAVLQQTMDEENLSKQAIDAQINIGICDLIERKLDDAQARLRNAIENCDKTSYLAGLPRAYYYLALVLDLENQFEEALHFASLAGELALKSEQSIARGAQILAWKIKDQNTKETE